MIVGARGRLFKYGSGTGPTSPICAAKARSCGRRQSSGLMSFLKIGDARRAAIQVGGTTRRAAKMVIVDTTIRTSSQFIDWKVKEEQKWRRSYRLQDQPDSPARGKILKPASMRRLGGMMLLARQEPR